MSSKPPEKPAGRAPAGKFAEREDALRANLLKRKQQQRARAHDGTTASKTSDKEKH